MNERITYIAMMSFIALMGVLAISTWVSWYKQEQATQAQLEACIEELQAQNVPAELWEEICTGTTQ